MGPGGEYLMSIRALNSLREEVQKGLSRIRRQALTNRWIAPHPQMWRAGGPGGRLGPFRELGPHLIIDILPNLDYYLVLSLERGLTESMILGRLRSMVYAPVRELVRRQVDSKVPADTYKLRNSMKEALTRRGGSIPDALPFHLELNTRGVPWANTVNNMPSEWLKHPGSHSGYGLFSKKTGRRLHDPGAKKGFYNEILLNAQNVAGKGVRNFRAWVTGKIGNTSVSATGLSKWNIVQRMFSIQPSRLLKK